MDVKSSARTALSHPALSGTSRQHLAELVAEVAPAWEAQQESALRERRGGDRRRREAGAGPKHRPVFVDRVLATLAHLRHDLPHSDLAVLLGVDRSTVSVAIRQVRPLLAARGFAVPDQPGIRLRTIEDVFAYAEAEDVELGIDGTDVQVRRPKAGRPGRKACVSGKCRQNTIKTTTFSDGQGRTLFCGVARPGRMHDQTAVRTEGIAQQLRCRPGVKVHVDEGCRGLANQFHHRSPPHPASRRGTRPSTNSTPGGRNAEHNPPTGSAWSTPTPSTSSGGPCSATSAAAKISPRPKPP
ncbi:transposase family protein [Actinacidiphila glaucinigra]|uniref:transposase family protein n=1 Tax=Actinacidiphila glaucinigra TaxID=235986 RepID=UPI002E36C9F6|nr:transposase family protein [Actinacidiphila glaucinigra]